jgi:uncharacterized protein YkwD
VVARRLIALAAAVALVPAGAAQAQDATCQPESAWGTARQDLSRKVVDLVNAHRASVGLAPLTISRSLTRAALWKSRHMLAYDYFEHDDQAPPVARDPFQRMSACGNAGGGGENIAYGQPTPEAVMTAWLESPGHRANIEEPEFTQIGVGAAGTTRIYWTQNFGTGELTDPNGAPAAQPDTLTVPEDAPPAPVALLSNDADDDMPWAYASVTEYAPPRDFNGLAVVGYSLRDLAGEQAPGTLTVTVTPVNDVPVARADKARFLKRSERVTVPVLRNDADVDGDPLTVTIVVAPRRGAAKVLADGRVRYRPRKPRRKDSLIYRVTDPSGTFADARLRLRIRR